MLKKKISAIITASTRLCKCGKIVTLVATEIQTICPKCNEIVYAENNDTNNGEAS